MNEFIGKVVQGGNGRARYRVVARDERDGAYILRSVRSPKKLVIASTLELMTRWRVIA